MLIEADAQLGRQSYYETSVQRVPPLQEAVEADVLVLVLVLGMAYQRLRDVL